MANQRNSADNNKDRILEENLAELCLREGTLGVFIQIPRSAAAGGRTPDVIKKHHLSRGLS